MSGEERAAHVLGIAALVRAGCRLQQPDALELADIAERWVRMRAVLVRVSLQHGSDCGHWMGWPCSCGLDDLTSAAS